MNLNEGVLFGFCLGYHQCTLHALFRETWRMLLSYNTMILEYQLKTTFRLQTSRAELIGNMNAPLQATFTKY